MTAYPDQPSAKTGDTSAEAAFRIAGQAARLREQCWAAVSEKEMTADETADAIDANILSVRPRLSELRAKGRVEDTGERRLNTSGMRAIVWRVVRPASRSDEAWGMSGDEHHLRR